MNHFAHSHEIAIEIESELDDGRIPKVVSERILVLLGRYRTQVINDVWLQMTKQFENLKSLSE